MNRPQKTLPDDVANIMPMPGHVFEGKYRIVNLIGAGGFARVFHARFEDVARDVALKVLLPVSADPATMYGEELVQRFLREARAVSELRSPNTITLHDFGRTRNGLLYMVFEYVDGQPLDRLIKQVGPMPPGRVIPIIRQVLTSLREAHAVGMLHRDIKPANVMVFDYLDHRDVVKLLDFGIAKTWTHDAVGNPILEDLTEDGTVMGTPRYMSPEQIVGQRLTPQSDIYSVGLLCYEMLCGAPAAPDTQKTDVVRRHLGPDPFVIPAQLGISAQLAEVVGRMVTKPIAQRYQNVDQVLNAFAQLESGYDPDVAETQATGSPMYMAAAAMGTSAPDDITPTGGVAIHPVTNPTIVAGGSFGATTQGGAAPQRQAVHLPTSAPGAVIARPQKTFLQVRASPESFEVDVPLRPTKRNLVICGATFIPFFVALTAMGMVATLLTAAGFAFGLSLIFTTYRLRITAQDGYELTRAVFGYERTQRGGVASVVRFEARGTDGEDDTVLKLVTHEGDFTVASAFSEAENEWVATEGNTWIAYLRAANPHPLG